MLAAVLLVGGLVALPRPIEGGEERHKWWQSDRVKAEVGLTADQSRELEAVFQAMLPRMRAEKEDLDQQERALSKLMSEATADEHVVEQAIERVEEARASASKTRTLMLYRMFRLLTPEQRPKLEALHERIRQEHATRADRSRRQ